MAVNIEINMKTKKGPAENRELPYVSRLQDSLHQEIANTYFKTSGSSKESSRKSPARKIGALQILPWAIAFFAIAAAIIIFVFKSSFDVKVRIVNGTPFVLRNGRAFPEDGSQPLLRSGESNRSLVNRAFFVGDGRASSAIAEKEISLSNAEGQGWASFVIEMKRPADLRSLNIRYLARGKRGDEKIVPVVVDSQNRSYRIDDTSLTVLSDEWQTYIIDFKPVKSGIDLANITEIRFEYGTETVGNTPTATIFLKDISLIKSRRVKWL